MPVYALGSLAPELDPQSWIAPNATVIAQVVLKKDASIWWNCTVRGDTDRIVIGEGTNIQDGSIIHTNRGIVVTLGNRVTVGHGVILHGCTIGDHCLIGMGATILNRVSIGRNSIVGAHSLLPEGKQYPERSLIMGSPGRVVRELTDEEVARLPDSAERYIVNWNRYRNELTPV
ncbi:gamma carbonic anhydrase family protein [Propionivibrio dicarboxylicus]|uniref:Carbonic anhydrase or acetyltransferase, isoleucine patch superfamily n=1 Tax=Propionivibrio dicarboxylicus TaxID=83767 RepID=A0A1G7Y938_9RHOO|nr:gamma carbonic anhydrase family protein [Propionivibrio dicarboxylicus]SDG92877.1 Carbonic anhydrase or acetyltransferase, isoleucine patch superfamily [Propionivibrio dicarboxylicus]